MCTYMILRRLMLISDIIIFKVSQFSFFVSDFYQKQKINKKKTTQLIQNESTMINECC